MTGSINPTLPVAGEPNSTADPKVLGSLKTLRDETNALLNSENKIPGTSLAAAAGITSAQLNAAAKPVSWYTPKIIATEESRTNTEFGTLTTADEITGVVLPENGLIVVGYMALLKQSVSEAARAAIFVGANQLKRGAGGAPAVQENLGISGIGFHNLEVGANGIVLQANGAEAQVTTGMLNGGGCSIFAAAGTYTISVRFKATSGSVTAKERKLWVYTLGV